MARTPINDDWLLIFHHSTPQFHIISFMISPHFSPHVWLQKASKIHHVRMIFLYFRWITSHFFGINPPQHKSAPPACRWRRSRRGCGHGCLRPVQACPRSTSAMGSMGSMGWEDGGAGWGCRMGVPCSHVGMAMECLVFFCT